MQGDLGAEDTVQIGVQAWRFRWHKPAGRRPRAPECLASSPASEAGLSSATVAITTLLPCRPSAKTGAGDAGDHQLVLRRLRMVAHSGNRGSKWLNNSSKKLPISSCRCRPAATPARRHSRRRPRLPRLAPQPVASSGAGAATAISKLVGAVEADLAVLQGGVQIRVQRGEPPAGPRWSFAEWSSGCRERGAI